jgi:FlaA1/EpsC-like NDP-sugar epimerase
MPLKSHPRNSIEERQRALIIGAGLAGETLANKTRADSNSRICPIGFIDIEETRRGQNLAGLPVLGNLPDLIPVVRAEKIQLVIIALPQASGKTLEEIVGICKQERLPVCLVNGTTENSNRSQTKGINTGIHTRDVELEDLLRNEPLEIDEAGLRSAIAQRRILVTGAGGSIGAELCRQIAQYAPAELVLLGHGEHSIFTLGAEFARSHPELRVARVIADVRDENRLQKTFATYRPHTIFHAAAHKHVALMEENIEDAVTNNVLGTSNVVKAALANEVENLISVSTDKAVNPANVMGATKRVAELIVCQAARVSGRRYVSVRFGNVLGSRGSVLGLFREQINRGGPVTVTHPEMSRYFMTIHEAVLLVLQAMLLGRGGEIFVLDMGAPLKIADLARHLIEFSDLEIGRDIDIKFTGAQPGEKLFEELFFAGDKHQRTEHKKIFVASNGRVPLPTRETATGSTADLDHQVKLLIEAASVSDRDLIFAYLKQIVPEYKTVGDTHGSTAGAQGSS